MAIIPVHPDDLDVVAPEHPTPGVAARRTLGRYSPTRRTLGFRKFGTHRTLGRNAPTRRTLMPRTRL